MGGRIQNTADEINSKKEKENNNQGWAPILFRYFPLRYVMFFYVLKEERYVLFHSFLEFLATYGTQKNVTFFSVLLQ